MKYSFINTVRFYNINQTVDWVDFYPYVDNQILTTDYYNQFKALPYVKEVPNTFIIQGYSETSLVATPPYLKIFKDGSQVGTYSFISNDNMHYTAYISDLADGIYYFKEQIPDEEITYVSDYFIVKSGLEDTIKVNAYNSANDFGVLFNDTDDGGPLTYNFSTLFIGNLDISEGKTEISQWTSDRGKIVNARTTINNYFTINIEVHKNYMQHVKTIFACDTLRVNGQECTLTDAPKFSPIEGTQLANCNINLQLTPNYYYL